MPTQVISEATIEHRTDKTTIKAVLLLISENQYSNTTTQRKWTMYIEKDIDVRNSVVPFVPLKNLCPIPSKANMPKPPARKFNTLEVKQTEVHEKASQSIKSKGRLPNLFHGIVIKTKDFLQNLIREKDMPPKPTLDIDMTEFRHMRNLMIKVQDKAREIKNLQDKVLPQLKQQLADTKGLFKGKDRKALEVKIKETEAEIADRLDKIPDTLKENGYPDVQIFMRTFREMESVVEQYNRDLTDWERQTSRKPTTAKTA